MSSTSIEIDFLILADRAEALNGKLYMMGGGWDAIGMLGPDQPSQLTAVVAFLVPWNATNIEHACAVKLEDADGNSVLSFSYAIKTGRPPSLPDGATQRVVACIPIVTLFPKPGMYAIVATAGDQEKRETFYVRAMPVPASPPPSQAYEV